MTVQCSVNTQDTELGVKREDTGREEQLLNLPLLMFSESQELYLPNCFHLATNAGAPYMAEPFDLDGDKAYRGGFNDRDSRAEVITGSIHRVQVTQMNKSLRKMGVLILLIVKTQNVNILEQGKTVSLPVLRQETVRKEETLEVPQG